MNQHEGAYSDPGFMGLPWLAANPDFVFGPGDYSNSGGEYEEDNDYESYNDEDDYDEIDEDGYDDVYDYYGQGMVWNQPPYYYGNTYDDGHDSEDDWNDMEDRY